jgi:hypothetical protein
LNIIEVNKSATIILLEQQFKEAKVPEKTNLIMLKQRISTPLVLKSVL